MECASTVLTLELECAMVLLVSACPALTAFSMEGRLPLTFLESLGRACPLLSALTIIHHQVTDMAYMQSVLLLQPAHLPLINSLTFNDSQRGCKLLDMSKNKSLRSVSIQHTMIETETDWTFLPPRLQHLTCDSFKVVPSAGHFLGALVSLVIDSYSIQLHLVAELLRSAPALQELRKQGREGTDEICISCEINTTTTAVDFLLLHQRQTVVRNATLTVIRTSEAEEALLLLLSSLPCMTGFTRFTLGKCHGYLLSHMLSALPRLFPDLQQLTCYMCMGDIELSSLAACGNLRKLYLARCSTITPMGLIVLCMRLPGLSFVECERCRHLTKSALMTLAQLLQRPISIEDSTE